jgi:hypothetical protein
MMSAMMWQSPCQVSPEKMQLSHQPGQEATQVSCCRAQGNCWNVAGLNLTASLLFDGEGDIPGVENMQNSQALLALKWLLSLFNAAHHVTLVVHTCCCCSSHTRQSTARCAQNTQLPLQNAPQQLASCTKARGLSRQNCPAQTQALRAPSAASAKTQILAQGYTHHGHTHGMIGLRNNAAGTFDATTVRNMTAFTQSASRFQGHQL